MEEFVVLDLVGDFLLQSFVAHLFLLVQDSRHLVDKVVGHDAAGCARGIANCAQLLLVLDAESSRNGGCNVHLFHILGDVCETILPLLDEGAARGVLGNDTDFLLYDVSVAVAQEIIFETYAGVLDNFQAGFELLCVLGGVLASDENLDGCLAILEGFEVGGYKKLALGKGRKLEQQWVPFFLVVTMCMESWVITKTVEGNS